MPANLPPQYFEAEKVYRQARTPEEKVEALEAMLAIMPKHKGTDKLRAELRRRIAKHTDEAERRPSGGKRASAYNVRKEGSGQVVLVGLPNAGKSNLVSALTETLIEVADYPFTTKSPSPAMMRFENIQIQLVDMPPMTDRDAKQWFAHLLRNADILLIVVDLADDSLGQMEAMLAELENMKVRVRDSESTEEISFGVVRKKAVGVGSKTDLDGTDESYERLRSCYAAEFPVISVSADYGVGLDETKRALFDALDVVRVHTKLPGKKAELDDPVVLKKGSTIEDVAESVHKDIRRQLKYAQIWGSGKFDGQRAKRGHVVEDGDIIELHA
jgi:small GTP-binding protein